MGDSLSQNPLVPLIGACEVGFWVLLGVEGLVHYVLVVEFDVLMGYAIASLLVAYLVGRSDRVVRVWAGVAGGVYVVAVLGITGLLLATPDGVEEAPAAASAAATASWTDQVVARLEYLPLFRLELLLIVPSATVLFLVGSRLLRAGTFDDTGAGAGSGAG